jgi:Holliday junction resolvase
MKRKRSKKGQAKHDNRVRTIAERYRRKGCEVKADIRRFPKPKPIGKSRRIPDIVATCGRKIYIFEVETPETLETDRDQQSTFRRSASQRTNTIFAVVLAR